MANNGVPVTRENYIRLAYGRMLSEDEWTPEDEAQLPRHLQDAERDDD